MSLQETPPIQGTETPASNSTVTAPEGTPAKLSLREAAQALRNARTAKAAAPSAEETPPPAAEQPEPVSAPEADAAAPIEEPSDETQEAPPAERPIIEPPRSWSKEARERWSTLDPETQAYLAERDRQDSQAVRTAQQQAAEERKALEAQRQQAEQVRQQYENALPVLLQTLQAQQQGEFGDIQSMDDVTRLARDDWPRYIQWDAQQKKMAAVYQEMQNSQQRQQQEQSTKWSEYATQEDALFAEAVPEIADPEKGPKLRQQAIEYLTDLGYTQEQLADAWNKPGGWLRDHKAQQAIVDAVKLRQGKAAVQKPLPKPVPPVAQRPGVSPGNTNLRDAQVKTLEQKLDKTGSWKAAAELLMAKRQAATPVKGIEKWHYQQTHWPLMRPSATGKICPI